MLHIWSNIQAAKKFKKQNWKVIYNLTNKPCLQAAKSIIIVLFPENNLTIISNQTQLLEPPFLVIF